MPFSPFVRKPVPAAAEDGVGRPEKRQNIAGKAATAEYIAGLCASLIRLAQHKGLKDLAYMLEVARCEAERAAHDVRAE